ncbi:MAG TPA: hypothetical protein VFP25_07615 [Nitrososphaeraceae archaeon]|nr:hypothetical protein [Nitrososphaeraceae archaeon]
MRLVDPPGSTVFFEIVLKVLISRQKEQEHRDNHRRLGNQYTNGTNRFSFFKC